MAERGRPLPVIESPGDGSLFSPKMTCPQLAGNGRCIVYNVRPMVCRLWGVVESMPCPYGCVPVGGYLTDEQGFEFLRASFEIGGVKIPSAALLARALADPKIKQAGRAFIKRGMDAERRRAK